MCVCVYVCLCVSVCVCVSVCLCVCVRREGLDAHRHRYRNQYRHRHRHYAKLKLIPPCLLLPPLFSLLSPSSKLHHSTRFKAAIIAVHRHGARINKKIGDIVLQAGDSLLLVTNEDFLKLYQSQDHFALVSAVAGHRSIRWNKAPIAVLLTVAMIALSVAEVISLLTAALFAAGGMVMFRCMSATEVRSAINLEVLLVIAAAFGLSNALVNSGAAELMAEAVVIASEPTGVTGLYIMVYIVTVLLSAVVTNNAAITIMFPVAFQAARDLDVRVCVCVCACVCMCMRVRMCVCVCMRMHA